MIRNRLKNSESKTCAPSALPFLQGKQATQEEAWVKQ
jgi:hypothetical protein